MPRPRSHDADRPEPGDTGLSLSELGLRGRTVSRRSMMKAGLGAAAGVGLAATVGTAMAPPARAGLNKLAKANASRVGGTLDSALITGPGMTDQFGAPYLDLGIPVDRADGSLLLIGGDTYGSNGNPGDSRNDWRAPTAMISTRTTSAGRRVVTGAISDRTDHAQALVLQDHSQPTDPQTGRPAVDNRGNPLLLTSLPTDAFRVGNTLYMHVYRGVYGSPRLGGDTEFFNSTNGGQTWNYLRKWYLDEYGGQFQQKTYAVADDAYVYCMTTVFQRETPSGLLLFRILKSDLNKTDADANASGYLGRYAYQAWGFANGRWAWGNLPTTICDTRLWGEICFRAMGGKYVLTWFQPNGQNKDLEDCRAMVFPLPTSDLFQTTEQTMVYQSGNNPSSTVGSVSPFPYAPFVIPGSTFANFNFVVSNWDQARGAREGYGPGTFNYCVSQWKTSLNPNI